MPTEEHGCLPVSIAGRSLVLSNNVLSVSYTSRHSLQVKSIGGSVEKLNLCSLTECRYLPKISWFAISVDNQSNSCTSMLTAVMSDVALKFRVLCFLLACVFFWYLLTIRPFDKE